MPTRTARHSSPASPTSATSAGIVAVIAGLAGAAAIAWAHWLDPSLAVGMLPVSGVALAALLVLAPRHWPLPLLTLAAAVTGAGLALGSDLTAAIAPAAAAVVGSVLAAALLRMFAAGPFTMRRTLDVAALALSGALGAAVGAAVGVGVAGTPPTQSEYWESAARAGFGDWLGIMVVTTLVLAWTAPEIGARMAGRREAVALGSAVVGLGILAFAVSPDPRAYVAVLVLVWAAIRFRVRGVALALLAMVLIADAAAARGTGPLVEPGRSLESTVLTLQTFATTALLALLFLAAALDERDVADTRRHIASTRFRRTFEGSPVGIALTTPDGLVVDANRALCGMLGRSRLELLGTRLEAHRSPEESTGEHALVQPAIAVASDAFSTERRYVSAHGERVWAEVSESEVRGPDGEPECGIVLLNDVTLRKDLEEQVLHAQKMDAVGRLAGGIAHDFNNLLAVMRGHAEMLEDDLAIVDTARERIVAMQRATDRAAALTDDLLTFSRRSTDEPEVVDVHDVLTAAADMLVQLAGAGVHIDLRLDATDTRVEADPRRIEQVLVNLVVNASDAMPDGGCLTLATANVVGSGPDGEPARGLQIAITDTGVGITPQVQRRIFEPFFTTKPPGSGTGLGLSTAYGVVRRYGGAITVESRLGEGTTFVITLPLSERPPPPSAPPTPETPAIPGSAGVDPGTILVVDDEAEVRVHVAETLRGCGYHVLEAADGGAALELVATTPGPIHLLLSDVVMPGIGGPELADRIRTRSPDTRVLFVSGHGDIEPSSPCLRGTTLLRKPVRRAALIAQVEHALHAHRTGIRAGSGTPRP